MFLNYCQNYQNIYKIVSVDPDGKNSRIVSRVILQSIINKSEMWIDLNTDFFPTNVGTIIAINLYFQNIENSSINTKKTELFTYQSTLLSNYDIMMKGNIFHISKIVENNTSMMCLWGSFGGLLLRIKIEILVGFHINKFDSITLYLKRL